MSFALIVFSKQPMINSSNYNSCSIKNSNNNNKDNSSSNNNKDNSNTGMSHLSNGKQVQGDGEDSDGTLRNTKVDQISDKSFRVSHLSIKPSPLKDSPLLQVSQQDFCKKLPIGREQTVWKERRYFNTRLDG